MPHTHLIPEDILKSYLNKFDLINFQQYDSIKKAISIFTKEYASGKNKYLNESQYRREFLNLLFSEILGYKQHNEQRWNIQDETCTRFDKTRGDAVLGYFYTDDTKNSVHAVIELKGYNIDLNEKQKKKISAVEQGFLYAPKYGESCNWVIVSDFEEIRFYRSNNINKYQKYDLVHLSNPEVLKELIFLFHKDFLLKEQGLSKTMHLLKVLPQLNPVKENLHILDELYNLLQGFKGLNFVDPHYISSLYPFNILDEYVKHYNNSGMLFSLNENIYSFFSRVYLDDNNSIHFNKSLQQEVDTANIENAAAKLEWIFSFLKNCLISQIVAIKNYKSIESNNKDVIGFSLNHIIDYKQSEHIEF